MASIRELKGRIGSVSTSEKITGAMKMISSAKMHKAMQALQRVEPFRQQIQSTIDNLLAADSEYTSPLTQVRPVKQMGIVLLGSDEGLCGAFNMMLFKRMLETINRVKEESNEEVSFVIYPIGKKVVAASKKLALPNVRVSVLPYMTAKSSGEKIKQMCDELSQAFLSEELDHIEIVFMEFLSMGRQRLANRIMLPVVTEASDKQAECTDQNISRVQAIPFRARCIDNFRHSVTTVGIGIVAREHQPKSCLGASSTRSCYAVGQRQCQEIA